MIFLSRTGRLASGRSFASPRQTQGWREKEQEKEKRNPWITRHFWLAVDQNYRRPTRKNFQTLLAPFIIVHMITILPSLGLPQCSTLNPLQAPKHVWLVKTAIPWTLPRSPEPFENFGRGLGCVYPSIFAYRKQITSNEVSHRPVFTHG